jgi:uncharacterized protein YndB with AHSA1/START domain
VDADPINASVVIDAEPDEIFEYFLRADAIVEWMGERASLDPRPGGEFSVDVQGTAVRGRYIEIEPPRRLLISWGFEGSRSLPPGASTVEVRLTAEDGGTRVEIVHRGLPAPEAVEHGTGWRYYLNCLDRIFANERRR